MELRRMLVYILIFSLIPVFFSGAIIARYVHPFLGLVIGVPAAVFAWPTMFALATALDEEDKEKRYKKYEKKEDEGP